MAFPNPSVLLQTEQQRVTNLLQTMTMGNLEVAYVGKTTGNTPTEIFLGGVTGDRFAPPEDSVLVCQWAAIARADVADTNTAHFIGRAGFSVIYHGTTLATIGTNAFIDQATTGNPATQAILGTASHLAFTVDNTNKRMVLTVTGLAATTLNWYVYLQNHICLPWPMPAFKGNFG